MRFADPLLGLVTTALFVGAVEGAVRVGWPQPVEGGRPEGWSVASSTLGWERRPGFRGHLPDIGKHPREFDHSGYLAIDSSQVAMEDRRRILVIGDSSAFGWGVATDDSFAEVLDRLLPDVDVINLGVPGYSSFQSRLTMERSVPVLSPAVVIMAGQFNDRRYVTPEDRPDSAERFAPLGTRAYLVTRQLERLHAGRAMLRQVSPRAETAHISQLRPRVDAHAYRRNLTDMATVARTHGVRDDVRHPSRQSRLRPTWSRVPSSRSSDRSREGIR